jgi:hypothetical protein
MNKMEDEYHLVLEKELMIGLLLGESNVYPIK